MVSPLRHLCSLGTKLWVDSVDLALVRQDVARGATGATSNPVIIESLVKSGHGAAVLAEALREGLDDDAAAWHVTDHLVSAVEQELLGIYKTTAGEDGYVSFELDPLIEAMGGAEGADGAASLQQRQVDRYVELGRRWSKGHPNRMIKVPATTAGIAALTPLAAAGIPLNVTLLFTARQYRAARHAVLMGIQQRGVHLPYKSVYSIFVSRLDVYAQTKLSTLSATAKASLGIVNAKRLWQDNQSFWREHKLPLRQEIVFASTGVKDAALPAWLYVEALAGSDIQTNPPATNAALEASGKLLSRHIDEMPAPGILKEIDTAVDMAALEAHLMADGIDKFVTPQRALLRAVAALRAAMT